MDGVPVGWRGRSRGLAEIHTEIYHVSLCDLWKKGWEGCSGKVRDTYTYLGYGGLYYGWPTRRCEMRWESFVRCD